MKTALPLSFLMHGSQHSTCWDTSKGLTASPEANSLTSAVASKAWSPQRQRLKRSWKNLASLRRQRSSPILRTTILMVHAWHGHYVTMDTITSMYWTAAMTSGLPKTGQLQSCRLRRLNRAPTGSPLPARPGPKLTMFWLVWATRESSSGTQEHPRNTKEAGFEQTVAGTSRERLTSTGLSFNTRSTE